MDQAKRSAVAITSVDPQRLYFCATSAGAVSGFFGFIKLKSINARWSVWYGSPISSGRTSSRLDPSPYHR
ncbi:hypothetical protein A1354_24290 [Pseudomonas asplenii]|nr:hypothetical protein [Pseudomonas asplenii]PNG42818.1 hypothetical protein A1354_24290 [Pseudomonas asplenii]